MKNPESITFSNEVIKQLDYYVYRLIDPRNGNTFYIGKGKGNRIFDHVNSGSKDNEGSEKQKIIREIKKAGLEVIYIIHRHGIKDEETAYEIEAALLDAYPEVVNENAGVGSYDYGQISAQELIKKYEALELSKFEHSVLMIKINQSIKERPIYEATRYAWRIDQSKAKKAEYVIAVEYGIIVGVFKAIEWKEVTMENGFSIEYKGRYGFVGEKAPNEVEEIYLNKKIPSKYRKGGASNPILYSF